MTVSVSIEARARGCILAGALGDALGLPIEFDGEADILEAHPAGCPSDLPSKSGLAPFSDDTQMTLFAVEGLAACVRGGLAIAAWADAIRAAYGRWYRTQSERFTPGGEGLLAERMLWVQRAPGITCLGALEMLADGRPTPAVESPLNTSKGCGTVMRAAPFGFVAASVEEAYAVGVMQSAVTHGHPAGYVSGGAMAAIVHLLTDGVSLADAAERAERHVRSQGEEALAVAEAIAGARAFARGGMPIAALGEGWTADEALAMGLGAALEAERGGLALEAALWRAACHDGDSDSTASIAGHLLGAVRGEVALPGRWLDRLEGVSLLDRCALDLASTARARRGTIRLHESGA